MRIVQHHEKYLELHGEDKIVMMPWDEHQTLHRRLRREGKCKIPSDVLGRISKKACDRTIGHSKTRSEYYAQNIQPIDFTETVGVNSELHEHIRYNHKTGSVDYVSRFRGKNGVFLKVIT